MTTKIQYSLDTDSRGVIIEKADTQQAWNVTGGALDNYDQTFSQYHITPADVRSGSTRRSITIPNVKAGLYTLMIFAGAAPLETAKPVEEIDFNWDGSKIVPGNSTPVPFLNTQVPEHLLAKVSTRHDGKLTFGPVRLKPSEDKTIGWDYSNRLKGGQWLGTMTLPVSGTPAKLTVVDEESGQKQWGINRELALVRVQVDASAAAGDTVTLTADIDGEKAILVVEVIAPSE